VAYAHSSILQKFRPVLYGLSFIFGTINRVVDMIFLSFRAVVQLLFRSLTVPDPEEPK
jgi:hypothetical protein